MDDKINVQKKYIRIFIFPALYFLLFIAVFPLIYVLVVSLLKYAMSKPYLPIQFIGLQNYIDLFKDLRFLKDFQTTIIYTFVTSIGSIVLGFTMAYSIWTMKDNLVKSVLQILWALPIFSASVIIGHGFRYMFQIGPLNLVMNTLGLMSKSPLGSYPDALYVIMLTEIWYWAPFCYLILLAGLYSIPVNRLEAAHADGAWAFERLQFTILPSLKYQFFVILLIRLMDSWKAYDFINSITKGGPGYSTETLSKYAFMHAFTWWNMGKSSAIGIFMLFITIATTWFFVGGIPLWRKIRASVKLIDKRQPQKSQESKWLFQSNYSQYGKKEGEVSLPKNYLDHIKKIRSEKKIKRKIYEKCTLFLRIFLSTIILVPYLFIIRSGFMTNTDALSMPIKWFFKPTFENFRYVLFENSVIPNLLVTFIIAVSVTAITLLLAVPAAYALARYKWNFNETTFFFVLTTRMGAPIAFGIPYYLLARKFNLLDSYSLMITVYVLMNLGFALWILKGFFEGIPKELDEVAFLQGATKPKAFMYIDLPLAKSGIAVAGIFTFMFSWNDYFYAVLLSGFKIRTFSVILPSYFIHHIPQWSSLSAAGTIYIIPGLIFAIVIFKLLHHGLTLGNIN